MDARRATWKVELQEVGAGRADTLDYAFEEGDALLLAEATARGYDALGRLPNGHIVRDVVRVGARCWRAVLDSGVVLYVRAARVIDEEGG